MKLVTTFLGEVSKPGYGLRVWKVATIGHLPLLNVIKRPAMPAIAATFLPLARGSVAGARRVRIPTCVETNIRQRFPGDGVYIRFNQE